MADRGEIKLREANINSLIELYHKAYADIISTIETATDAGKINKIRTMAAIKSQLRDLGDDVDAWVKKEIPQYYLDGANMATQDLKALGVDLDGPRGMTVINRDAVASLVDDTSLAFAQGLTGIARNAQMVLSKALKQQLNFIIAEGKLTGETLKVVSANVKQRLLDEGLTAIKDRAGRDWTFDRYAEMLVRTKAVESRNAGMQNKMVQYGYDLVQVSDHNSSHKECHKWEGKILSITGQTPGFDTTTTAEMQGLLHPNCQHAYNVISPELAAKTKAYENPYLKLSPEERKIADLKFANRNRSAAVDSVEQ